MEPGEEAVIELSKAKTVAPAVRRRLIDGERLELYGHCDTGEGEEQVGRCGAAASGW